MRSTWKLLLLVWLGCATGWSYCGLSSVQASASNSLMDISQDGTLLACSNRDSGSVTIVTLADHQVSHELPVGLHPEGVTFVGDSHILAVCVYGDDRVVLVDADHGSQVGTIEVFDEPYGVVSNRAGSKLYATLDYPGKVVEIDVAKREVIREMEAGPFSRGIALTSAEDRLLVTEYYTADVVALSLAEGKVVDRWASSTHDNLARQITLHPTRPKAYLPHIRSRVTAVHGEGSIFPYLAMVDTAPLSADEAAAESPPKRRRKVPMDSFRGALVTSNPWECAIAPDGRTAVVVFAGTDDLFVCDVIDDDYREIGYREYLRIGKNPRAVRFDSSGEVFYIYHALDFEVVGYRVRDLERVAKVTVTKYPHDDEMLHGKILFYSAQQPMASRRWISCASCHPDGDPDGRTWDNPEGPRNTQSLAGMAWTHPIHWSADRDEVQDFEHTIRGKLMQGRGLLQGELQPELGAPNAGLSADLDALAKYSNSHGYALSPHAKQGLSEAAKRGRALFFSEATQCATCHAGPFYTDSSLGGELKRHDVGTGGDPAEKLGPAFDTPSLLGVYRTAPYLHHGRALTLEQVLVEFNPADQHGKTSHLTANEVRDLVEFLKALPYVDPEAEAIAQGRKKVQQ